MRYRLELEPVANASILLSDKLTPGEKQLYESLKVEKRRKEWLAGRIAAKRLMRKILEGMGVKAADDEIAILNDPSGVPFAQVGGAGRWPLSISHSGDWAVAAMDSDLQAARIGVDIEKIEPRDPSWLDVAFHPSETSVQRTPEELTRLWARKESVLKFLALGLSVDLHDIRMPLDSNRLELHGKAGQAWNALGQPEIVIDFPNLCSGYSLCVAYAASSRRN